VGTTILYTDAAAGAIHLPAVTIDDTARSGARAKFGHASQGCAPCVADLGPLIRVRVGDRLIVHFTNLHGFFFQVLDSRGVPLRPLA
jgi:hypothetical protein